jgi:hypothetical protein
MDSNSCGGFRGSNESGKMCRGDGGYVCRALLAIYLWLYVRSLLEDQQKAAKCAGEIEAAAVEGMCVGLFWVYIRPLLDISKAYFDF